MRRHLITALLAASLGLAAPCATAQSGLSTMPEQPDPARHYLFFLHGLSVEQLGPDSYSKEFRKVYQTTEIARKLAEAGPVVIADIRPKGTRILAYAEKLAAQVRALRAAGVPARQIALVGHSKGASIALATASLLQEPELRYALLAGCPLPSATQVGGSDIRANYERLLADNRGKLQGRFLSLYDTSDDWMGSCSEVQAGNPGLQFQEQALQSGMAMGMGHSLFYSPEPLWLQALFRGLALGQP
jgi:acetyl esterase/lipase